MEAGEGGHYAECGGVWAYLSCTHRLVGIPRTLPGITLSGGVYKVFSLMTLALREGF